MQGSGAAHATHDFIKDQQHTVLIANLADTFEVTGHRCQRTRGCPDNRLGDECRNVFRPKFEDCGFQFIGNTQAICFWRFIVALIAILINRCNVACRDQKRLKLFAPPHIATHRKRTQSIAVIGLPTGNDVFAVRLADLQKILARHFKGCFGRL